MTFADACFDMICKFIEQAKSYEDTDMLSEELYQTEEIMHVLDALYTMVICSDMAWPGRPLDRKHIKELAHYSAVKKMREEGLRFERLPKQPKQPIP